MNLTPKLKAKIAEMFKTGFDIAELSNMYEKRPLVIEGVLRDAMIACDRAMGLTEKELRDGLRFSGLKDGE